MKTVYFTLLCVLQLVIPSCHDYHFENRFGFNTTYNQNASGLCIMEVKPTANFVCLEGTVTADSGELEITLTDGKNMIQYQKQIKSDNSIFTINEKIIASPGYWKLRYKSNQAVGSIDLHLNYEN